MLLDQTPILLNLRLSGSGLEEQDSHNGREVMDQNLLDQKIIVLARNLLYAEKKYPLCYTLHAAIRRDLEDAISHLEEYRSCIFDEDASLASYIKTLSAENPFSDF